MDDFERGYAAFEKNYGTNLASCMGAEYVNNVRDVINNLKYDLNAFDGYDTDIDQLKGNIAEVWHSGTFNVNAAAKLSPSRAYAIQSNKFASPDIISNFGSEYGLKYYKDPYISAKAQSASIYERFREYHAKGGTDSLETFLQKRHYPDTVNIHNPIYKGQTRIVPEDHLAAAKEYLKKEIGKRPEQAERYEDTLHMITDRIKSPDGVESVPLSKADSEDLATLGKNGDINSEVLKKLGISTEDAIKYKDILKNAFNAGISAAVVSMVVAAAPEICNMIACLIQTGEIDGEQFKKIGFSAVSGGTESFIRGSLAAAITAACKSGLWGETVTSANPSVVGAAVVVTMNTIKNAFKTAVGKMQPYEMVNELVRDMFVSTCTVFGGSLVQSITGVPVLGFMLGSLIGSMIGSLVYTGLNNIAVSFCIDTGFTMFGIVQQDYTLPADVLKTLGIDFFEYEKVEYEHFEPKKFQYEKFSYNQACCDLFEIRPLRRGVIGISRIGYI